MSAPPTSLLCSRLLLTTTMSLRTLSMHQAQPQQLWAPCTQLYISPPTTEQTFAAQVANETEHHHHPYGSNEMMHTADGLPDTSGGVNQNGMRPTPNAEFMPPGPKPAVGSEEWHKLRKDNHKEVERRRRETINEGINELAKIVPGCEKNKGSILARAVSFITQLKENEAHNLERWTIEKLLTEQAISELSASNDKLKQECDRIYREMNVWKQLAQNAG
ncbi:hypothetical protein PG987_002568 [Apiospora arundinis]